MTEQPAPDQPEAERTDGVGVGEAEAAQESSAPPGPPATEPAEPTVEQQLAERTADLQRLQAEYVNYKRRVDRDRQVARAQGEAKVLESLLTVLDDLGRAEEHGELVGGFKAVADLLQATVKQHGLEAFGSEGDEFDPAFHEAVFQVGQSAEIETTVLGQVLRIGYRVGDRVLRPATVGVLQPADGIDDDVDDQTDASDQATD